MDFCSLDEQIQRLVMGELAASVLTTIARWRWMLALWGVAAAFASSTL
jgi:hypothetical protein